MDGIWSNALLKNFDLLPQNTFISCGEGNTSLKFVELPGNRLLGIKDENENPNGSFKDRSLAYQLSMYLDQGYNSFVISSSGNAAIAAASLCAQVKATLDVFISEKINPLKLKKLEKIATKYAGIVLHKSAQAKSDAVKYAQEKNIINLRGSQDDLAIPGFKTIAYELSLQYPQLDAVFIPCSSGTSTLALCQAFQDLGMSVRVFACQTTKVHPIANAFVTEIESSKTSLADAITDRVALRRDAVVTALKNSGGGALIISDDELEKTKLLMTQYGFAYSYNSLLGFAGYFQNQSPNLLHPVVIASGL